MPTDLRPLRPCGVPQHPSRQTLLAGPCGVFVDSAYEAGDRFLRGCGLEELELIPDNWGGRWALVVVDNPGTSCKTQNMRAQNNICGPPVPATRRAVQTQYDHLYATISQSKISPKITESLDAEFEIYELC